MMIKVNNIERKKHLDWELSSMINLLWNNITFKRKINNVNIILYLFIKERIIVQKVNILMIYFNKEK